MALTATVASGTEAPTPRLSSTGVQDLEDYTSLRAYAGLARSVLLRRAGIAGHFIHIESDDSSIDDGGTIVVSTDNRRWRRVFTGPIDVAWFARKDDSGAIQAAIDAAYASSEGRVQLGAIHILSRPISVRPGISLVGRGPAYAGGEPYSAIPGTTIKTSSDFVGNVLFQSSVSPPDNVLTSVQFEQLRVDLSECNAHGFLLEDVYDGVVFRNVHVVGAHKSRHACWLTSGHYGLGQTALFENCQFLGRKGSTRDVAPFRADALNESTFVNCKFFGASGGLAASTGAAMELSGSSGLMMLNCSFAFAEIGISIEGNSRRKTFGIQIEGGTFEALTRCALKARSTTGRQIDSVSLTDPRYYDSVFSFPIAVDVDGIENSHFDSLFKKALIGQDTDQVTVVTQRLSLVASKGSNTLVISRPNRLDKYFGIGADVRVTGDATIGGAATFCGGVRYRSRIIETAAQHIEASDTILLVKCGEPTEHVLPSARSSTPDSGQVLFVRNIGRFKATLTAAGLESIDGQRALVLQPSASIVLASDGIGSWWSIDRQLASV
jgi:hypothetical protein